MVMISCITKDWIDHDNPVILSFGFDNHGRHWEVAVGHALMKMAILHPY
jgi:hypothetical protein